jgi:hypothetical protein
MELHEEWLEPIKVTDDFYTKDTITPQILKDTGDSRFLRKLGKYGGGGGGIGEALGGKLPLVIFFIIVFAVAFLMTYGYQTGWKFG